MTFPSHCPTTCASCRTGSTTWRTRSMDTDETHEDFNYDLPEEEDMERDVTINEDQELYVINNGTGVSGWGFDVVLDRIKRIAIELAGRGKLPAEYMEVDDLDALISEDAAAVRALLPPRGTMRAYDTMQNLLDVLKATC